MLVVKNVHAFVGKAMSSLKVTGNCKELVILALGEMTFAFT
jgi:hypothetical protein